MALRLYPQVSLVMSMLSPISVAAWRASNHVPTKFTNLHQKDKYEPRSTPKLRLRLGQLWATDKTRGSVPRISAEAKARTPQASDTVTIAGVSRSFTLFT